jgi:hypothetical protein
MAIQTVDGVITFGIVGGRVASTATAFSQPDIGYGMGFQFAEAVSITRFAVYTSNVTTNPSNAQIGLQNINMANGLPTGTWLTSVAANTYTANSWNIFTLATPYSLAAGSKVFALWYNNAGSTMSVAFASQEQGVSQRALNPSISVAKTTTAGTFAKQAVAFPMFIGTATKWYGESHIFGNVQYIPNTTDEFGFSFTMPNNIPEVKLAQIETGLGVNNNPTFDVSYKIYNSAGTLLQTINTYDVGLSSNLIINGNYNILHTNATDLWLQPGQKYYCMIALTGAATSWTYNLSKSVDINSSSTGIQNAYATKVGSTFTESSTEILPFRIICDACRYNDSSGGGGGGYVNASPMFSGGFNG